MYKTIKKLNIPIFYIALKILDNRFRIYLPENIEENKDIKFLTNYILKLSKNVRNPIFTDEDYRETIQKLREALEESLKV